MARRDLTEREVNGLAREILDLADGAVDMRLFKAVAEKVRRLAGEVLELRGRESHVQHMHGLEGPY